MTDNIFGDRYIDWANQRPRFTSIELRDWLLKSLPYEIDTDMEYYNDIDMRDVGKLVEGSWSSVNWSGFGGRKATVHYFFKLESDAMAFKLKWM